MAQPTGYPPQPLYATDQPKGTRNAFTLLILLLLVAAGAGVVGYLAGRSATPAVSEATLSVVVENEAGVDQEVAVFVNGALARTIHVSAGGGATFTMQVGWTGVANGQYEVRGVPAVGGIDTERVTAAPGQTVVASLRVGG